MQITGVIKKVYSSKENWASISVLDENSQQLIKAAGKIISPVEGNTIVLEGKIENNHIYGEQFKVTSSKMEINTKEGIINFLSSGFIKGVGPARAKKIVDTFGLNTIKVIEENPEKLTEIQGISAARANTISEMCRYNKAYLQLIELLGNGATDYQIKCIYKKYGDKSVEKIKENPYDLIYAIDGFGFIKADNIAKASGISPKDSRRLAAAITYTLKVLSEAGHCYCCCDELETHMKNIIPDIDTGTLSDVICSEIKEGRIVLEEDRIYTKELWVCETKSAEMIVSLLKSEKLKKIPDARIAVAVREIEKKTGYELGERQKEAIKTAVNNRICVITGGPGTGKTTIIQGFIKAWNDTNLLLAAPTGRAARRMEEVTGIKAVTIHSMLLEIQYMSSEELKNMHVCVIVDEASMIDISLAYRLLKFITESNSSLVLIGDIDQLPPIGPGNFFRDLVQSPCVPTVCLELSYRQKGKIALNAKRINMGESANKYIYDESFCFIDTPKEEVHSKAIEEYMKLLEEYPLQDVCCITPIRKNSANGKKLTSADALNEALRERLNPLKSVNKQLNGCRFRIGDRVMQLQNDNDRMISNGDCGFVEDIDEEANVLTVRMDDGRKAEYTPAETKMLTLAYATTVHKAQGSEYSAVIVLQCWEHYKMLERSLFYTAVTRAKKKVIIIGQEKAINYAVKTVPSLIRHTQLKIKIGKGVSI